MPNASSLVAPSAKSVVAPQKAPKVKAETGKPGARTPSQAERARGELHASTAKPAEIPASIHVSSHAAAPSTKTVADQRPMAHAPKDGPPLVDGKFPYVPVRGMSNVYFHEGKVWVGNVEKPGRFILDSKHRLFSESGIGEFNSAGMRYYEKTKVTVATALWYPGLGVDDDGHLVLHGVVHPEAGSGYSVRPMTGDPRDGIGPAGGELYRNGKLVDSKKDPIVLAGQKVEHALENFSLGEGSNMGPGF